MRARYVLLAGVVVGVLVGLLTPAPGVRSGPPSSIRLGPRIYAVAPGCYEVTPAQRQRGLTGRRLGPSQACVFLFAARVPGVVTALWMQQTPGPLEAVWLRGARIVGVVSMSPCSQSCPYYWSPGPVTEAVEVPAGSFPASSVGAVA